MSNKEVNCVEEFSNEELEMIMAIRGLEDVDMCSREEALKSYIEMVGE